MGSTKDRNGMDLTEAEDIQKRWQEYAEELYKKDLHDPDNHDGVITDLEPDILECEVKCGRVGKQPEILSACFPQWWNHCLTSQSGHEPNILRGFLPKIEPWIGGWAKGSSHLLTAVACDLAAGTREQDEIS